jgi:phosphate-selective porin OprO/OprP
MKSARKLVAAAILASMSVPAMADREADAVGGTEISFEGLVQADYLMPHGSDSDAKIRRAELVLKGKGPGPWSWVVGYDANAGKWLDANLQYRFNGSSFVRVGQFKQPSGLEELGSTRHGDFIAKAMGTNLQAVSRRVGIAVGTGSDHWSITGSAFTRALGRDADEGNGFGARATWAPILDGRNFLHLGLSYAADRTRTGGMELAWAHGALKLQSEYMFSKVARSAPDANDFGSWYASAVWNLTGETWGYKDGVVATSLPSEPASGMWQLGLRREHLDLDDGGDRWTIGVNWYWRSNFKVALDYARVDGTRFVERDPSVLEARAQFYW